MSDAEQDLFLTELENEMKEQQKMHDAASEESFLKWKEESIKAGGVMREVALAAASARESIKSDGLLPTRGEHLKWIYTPQQGYMAACFAREDAAITLTLQKTQLDYLHSIKWLLWCCVCLLAYIAYNTH